MSDSKKIRLLCIDDHPTVLDGLSAILNLQPDMMVAGTSPNGRDGLQQFRGLRQDVVLVDLRLPDMSGLEVIEQIKAVAPNARIIVLSSRQRDVDIRPALD